MWLMNADGTHQRALTQGSDVQWSPDGKRIAYVGKGEPSGSADLRPAGWTPKGATTQISHRDGRAVGLEWSPDGKCASRS